MNVLQITLTILGSISALGIAAGGIGYLVKSFRQGGTDAVTSSEKLVAFWKEQAEGFQEMLERKELASAERINKLSSELGELKGKYAERDKQYQEVLAILKDRNPESQAFMKLLTDTALASTKFMADQNNRDEQWMQMFTKMIDVLNDIHKMSTSNHEILKAEQGKELNVKAVITKTPTGPVEHNRRNNDVK